MSSRASLRRRVTWVPGAEGSLWDVDNLPYGVFAHGSAGPTVGARIGDQVVDLAAVFQGDDLAQLFDNDTLNPLMAAGPVTWARARTRIVDALTDESRRVDVEPHLRRLAEVTLCLPIEVADYVDFYASLDHATNVGRIFRPDAEPLRASWRRLPVGYHGRSGTVVVSGTEVRRPKGQRQDASAGEPEFGPSVRLDVEAELGYVVGVLSRIGEPVEASRFGDHIFGVVGLNDWSARDIPAWESVPLGPFLGKSFATSISSWVTPLSALEDARVDLPLQEPQPLPYLQVGARAGYDIDVEVEVNGQVVSRPPYRTMYWGPAQMLAHLTVNGASLRTGDLYGSGTISGPEREQRGSFLELSWGGTEPWSTQGAERTFFEDGDEVVLRLTAPGAFGRIGLGEVRGAIRPARI